MHESANLNLPYLMPSQAQKHITHNEALARLDAVVQLAVIDRDLTAPPGSPDDGDRYIVAAGATGAWSGWDLDIAFYAAGAWQRLLPSAGWICWVDDESALLFWDGAAWQLLAAANLGALGKAGDSMTGPLGLTHQSSPADPPADVLLVFAKSDDKLYTRTSAGAETEIGAGGGGGPADAEDIAFTPAGGVAATDVQAAIEELDAEKLALAGGTVTGSLVTDVNGVVGLDIVAEGSANTLRATKHIDTGGGAVFVGRKSRGSKAAPTALQTNDLILGFRAYGYNGTGSDGFLDSSRGAAFLLEASETWTAVATGTQIRFFVTPNGNTSLGNVVEHTRFANDGALQMGGANTVFTASRHPQLRGYTVAGLPSAATAGQLIYVSNETGGAVPAFSDGTSWRRVTDRAVVA